MTEQRRRSEAKSSEQAEGRLFEGRDDFLQLFKKGAEFYEELLAENNKLRYDLLAAEQELKCLKQGYQDAGLVAELEQQLQKLQAERQDLLDRYQDIEQQSQEYLTRYAEIEEEHNTLANLYIASYQLHSTLSFAEVSRIILEIAINLIGIGRLVLYVLDTQDQKLYAVAADGVGEQFDLSSRPAIALGQGVVGEAVQKKARFIAEPPGPDADPLAVLPLLAGDELVGALVLERFLVQKTNWSNVDHELFTLMSAHAGTALMASALRLKCSDGDLFSAEMRKQLVEGL